MLLLDPATLAVAGRIDLGPSRAIDEARRGEMIFHDGTYCFQHWLSCSTCHPSARADGNNWYLLNPGNPMNGGADGKTYRLHTTNSTPAGESDSVTQSNVKTEQNFAVYTTATGGTPNIYGLGAMEMFTPLTATGTVSSQFYLAQIPAYYAGKTLELNLWDAGDLTTGMTGSLSLLVPSTTVGTWTPINFSYKAATSGPNAAPAGPSGVCSPPSASGSNVASVSTFTSSASTNNCWLTLTVTIPTGYTAPQNGWWQIRYNMTGTGQSSNDTTSWTAHILGNPVHLVVP